MGMALTNTSDKWYGEPSKAELDDYRSRASQLGLNDDIAIDTRESLTTRLWRRYGRHAGEILDMIARDPACAAPIIPGMGLRRCEIEYMAEHEMVVTLEDLLRRRSKLGLLVTTDVLRSSPDLSAVCEILFGDRGPEKLQAYIDKH